MRVRYMPWLAGLAVAALIAAAGVGSWLYHRNPAPSPPVAPRPWIDPHAREREKDLAQASEALARRRAPAAPAAAFPAGPPSAASTGPAAVPALAERLQAARTQAEVLAALETAASTPGTETLGVLVAYRPQAAARGSEVLQAWCHAMGRAGGRSALPELVALARTDLAAGDWAALEEVLLATSQPGDAAAFEAMAGGMPAGRARERIAALAGHVAASAPGAGERALREDAPAAEVAARLASAEGSTMGMGALALIRRLEAMDSPQAAEALGGYVRARSARLEADAPLDDLALNAFAALCRMRQPASRPPLCAMLQALGPKAQASALAAVGEFGRPQDEAWLAQARDALAAPAQSQAAAAFEKARARIAERAKAIPPRSAGP